MDYFQVNDSLCDVRKTIRNTAMCHNRDCYCNRDNIRAILLVLSVLVEKEFHHYLQSSIIESTKQL